MGFSPRIEYSSHFEASVFLKDGAEQECSGYLWGPRLIADALDKHRIVGFSPRTSFLSSLKSPVFFMDGAEQECSGYILSSASFLLGRRIPTPTRDTAHVCPSLSHAVG